MLLDLDLCMTVFKLAADQLDEVPVRLGIMATGLAGEYGWCVDISAHI